MDLTALACINWRRLMSNDWVQPSDARKQQEGCLKIALAREAWGDIGRRVVCDSSMILLIGARVGLHHGDDCSLFPFLSFGIIVSQQILKHTTNQRPMHGLARSQDR